ncbi:MAG: spore cortex-lytic protein [Clostridiales bacterium]|nr:spore cortex-lytic protein [Clostridiales bacterium]
MAIEPYIPTTITVHLGPPDSNAQNVTVSFPDYIKNVASSEIYPTWPENALRANIYAQTSFALNRIFTEFYRNQGYSFDITNSTAYDQSYVPGRDVFENISVLVDEMFNSYVRRQGSVEPYFTQYCNGTTVTCDGLSQWGTVDLANAGYTPYQILTNYYGNDIDIVRNAPVRINSPSYPGQPLRFGDSGNVVQNLQVRINRISRNYPSIPKISPVTTIYDQGTVDAVRAFQRIFDLPVTGITDEATWYRIGYLYSGVKRLSELDSEGLSLQEVSQQYANVLQEGDTGVQVSSLQYYLAVIGTFYETVPPINVTGTFDAPTREAVIAFQKTYGLTPDGIVGRATWNDIVRAYRGILDSGVTLEGGQPLYPGTVLSLGAEGPDVLLMQQYLNTIAEVYPAIPIQTADGIFDTEMRDVVYAFQHQFGLEESGIIGPITWVWIVSLYSDLTIGGSKQPEQFPGATLQEG